MLLFCPEPIQFFFCWSDIKGKSRFLSNSEFKAHSQIFNTCIYSFIFFKQTYLPPQPNLICCHIPELSAPLCRTAGLFISGCFSQTSDWNAAWNHRLPPRAPRMLCIAALSLLPSQQPGLFSEAVSDLALCLWFCWPAAAAFAKAGEVSWAAALQNTLIISLNHCTVMGHRSCQLWWNETEDRKRARHHNGHTGRSCPSWHLYFLYKFL